MKINKKQNTDIYKKMYLSLFNSVTDILEDIESDPVGSRLLLMAAQMDCETMYIRNDPEYKARRKHRSLAIYF